MTTTHSTDLVFFLVPDTVFWYFLFREESLLRQQIFPLHPVQFQNLLVDAYAADLADWMGPGAESFLRNMDVFYRGLMIRYAGILASGNEDAIITGFAELAAELYGSQLGIPPSALIEEAKKAFICIGHIRAIQDEIYVTR